MSSDIPKFVVCEVCRLRVEACKCEQPPQPGDGVWVRAVVERVEDGIAKVSMAYKGDRMRHVTTQVVGGVPLSSIHPAPPASAKKHCQQCGWWIGLCRCGKQPQCGQGSEQHVFPWGTDAGCACGAYPASAKKGE